MNLSNQFIKISNRIIGYGEPAYFIADIAANHDGNLERAKELIHLAAEAGADAAKFQHFKAEKIVSDFGFKAMNEKQSHQASWKKSVYEVYSDASVNWDWNKVLKATCDDAGIAFFSTPYDLEVVDELDLYVPAYKIGSGDITWMELIRKVAGKNKPYMLATGASNSIEIERAVTTGLAINSQFALMQCNTNYTAEIENFKYLNLNVLKTFQAMYPGMILGLSDHTPGHSSVLGAIALGAKIIEKHFTDSTRRDGPDHKFSMDFDSWSEMVFRTRELEAALGSGVKRVELNELETVVVQRRSMRAKKDLKSGAVILKCDFEPLRPCPRDAVDPSDFELVIGGTLCKDIAIGDYLRVSDVR
uniref:N-acetylneuraminate synthase family protein n=1 Tax=Polynucleobacter sp. TaxID=2029855 RepID=UPI004048583B